MKKILVLSLAIFYISNALGWGGGGHNIVAAVAEENLTKKAKKKVTALLDGRSMVYYASWMDNIKEDSAYKHTSTWHYANVDEGMTYETMPKNPNGDVLVAVNDIISQFKPDNLSDSLQTLYIKYLVHLVGDLHCPMHAGRLSDLGGNKVTVYWFNSKINLHSLWDSAIVDSSHKWSYTEWVKQLDILSKAQKKEAVKGTPADWFNFTVGAAKEVYDKTQPNGKYSYDYLIAFTPMVESQLELAGLRLAAILNQIYK